MGLFEINDKHIKLLRNANVGWVDCEFGAPSIDCKRPYGNGNVVGDIVKLLFGDLPEEAQEALADYARQLHKETQTALQIVLFTGSFDVGKYKEVNYGKWEKVT